MILTFDVGTTAIKTSLFDRSLSMVASRTDEYDLDGNTETLELNPTVYWDTIQAALAALRRDCDLLEVSAVCLTTQGETLIPLDRDGHPLHPAIVWLDGRAKEQAEHILTKVSPEQCYARTGVTDMNGFVPLAKLLWFKQERPDIYENTYKFLLLEDYLLYRLTGRFVTEKSLLTSTAYYDIRQDAYWSELLQALELDENKLPEVLECGAYVSPLQSETAQELDLPKTAKVFAGAMDQIAAAIGGGGLREGVVTATVGTAMVLTSAIPSMDACGNSSVIVYRGASQGQYVLLPLCPTAGAVFKWFKDQCCGAVLQQAKESGRDVYDLLCEEAANVEAGAEGVTLLPYFAGMYQPNCLPEAKGVFFGLGLGTKRSVMTRAVLESVGYMLRENLEMLRSFGVRTDTIHFFGGGAKNPIWNQIIADITGAKLVLLEKSECGSCGAAMLAAVSMGWYASVAEAQNTNQAVCTVMPNPEKEPAYQAGYVRYTRLLKTLTPIFTE